MTRDIRIPSRIEAIQEQKKGGGLVAAVFPVHYPRALLRAHNILPVEVWGPPHADTTLSDARLQSYTCSVVRHGLSYLMAGGLDRADVFVVPHCCDTLQGLGSILLDFVPQRKPTLPLYIPRGRREVDIDFFSQELAAVSERLTEISKKSPDNRVLADAIKTEKEANIATKALLTRRRNLSCTNREFYEVLRSREYLPAEQFTALINKAIAGAANEERGGIPIVLSGVVPEPMNVLDALGEMGAVVVADDFLGIGRRVYGLSKTSDPWRRMAETIIQGPPDSTRGSSFAERLAYVLDLVQASRAQGVVFYHVKFCEPEQFYLPALRKGLEEAHIPSVLVEVDIGDRVSKQVITRLEAFVEMLS